MSFRAPRYFKLKGDSLHVHLSHYASDNYRLQHAPILTPGKHIKYKTNVYLFQQNEEFEGTNTFLFIPQIFCFLY